MEKNNHALFKRKVAVVCFQEHKISAAQMAAMEDEVRRNVRNLECGPCDDTTKQPSAGVGAATRDDHVQMIPTSTYTDDFKEAYESGRVKKHTIDLGWEDHVIIYCMHGVSGGTPEAIKATDHLVAVIKQEMQHDPSGPKLIVGDVNAVPGSIPAIREMIAEDHWTDVGGKAHWW